MQWSLCARCQSIASIIYVVLLPHLYSRSVVSVAVSWLISRRLLHQNNLGFVGLHALLQLIIFLLLLLFLPMIHFPHQSNGPEQPNRQQKRANPNQKKKTTI